MATHSTLELGLKQEEVITLGRLRAQNIAQFQAASKQVNGAKNFIKNNILKLAVMSIGALLFFALT
ncbi:MAG: hypothetical protein PVF65_04320 [Sphingomonadales bacterium]|jgi:hypothetical protein